MIKNNGYHLTITNVNKSYVITKSLFNNFYYQIYDVLKELLIWCFNILRKFVSMMIQYWFILDKKPKREEVNWFNFVVGERQQ